MMVFMFKLTATQWIIVAVVLFLLNLISCFRIARWARLTGRNPTKWFLITFFFSSIPAGFVHIFSEHRSRLRSPPPLRQKRCPHCRRLIFAGQQYEAGKCPSCGQKIDNSETA